MVTSEERVNVALTNEIIDLLTALRQPGVCDINAPFQIVPQTLKILDLENFMPRPARIRKAVNFIEVEGFLHYYDLFSKPHQPRIFSVSGANGITFAAVFDYDVPGSPVVDKENNATGQITAPAPRWNSHIAFLDLKYSRDYQTLIDNADKWFEQEDFALFIEENTHLFVQPDGATMLEIAQEMKGTRTAKFQAGKRLANGQVSLEYIEEIDAKTTRGDMQIPDKLNMFCPIFEGFKPQDIAAAFRYRLGQGEVSFSFRLLTKLAERAAEEEVKQKITVATGLPIYGVSKFAGIIKA